MEIRVDFPPIGPKERQLLQSRATQNPKLIKAHAGSFRVSTNHRTLTWTAGSLTCVRDHSYDAPAYTRGWPRRQRVSTTFLTREKLSPFFNCVPDAGGGSNLRSMDLESDALPTEPPRQ